MACCARNAQCQGCSWVPWFNPSASGTEIGQLLGQEFRKPWSGASQRRVGNSLRQWALWIRAGEIVGKIPNPTRLRTNASEKLLMPELPFDSSK